MIFTVADGARRVPTIVWIGKHGAALAKMEGNVLISSETTNASANRTTGGDIANLKVSTFTIP